MEIDSSVLTTRLGIGSLNAFLMLVLGAFSGRLSDAGYFHQLLFLGTSLQIIGFFTASISTTYWQILLSHSVCLGIGGGLIFVPTMSIAGTYFSKKRPFALAIVALGNSVGRLGHGLGLQLTEWPSNTATDNTILEPGVILTLEPGMEYLPGKEMVHEENIVITENGPEWLTNRASEELPIIQ